MPKLKQPVSLQKVSMDVLLEFVLNYCDQLSVKGSLAELRQGISIIKKHVCNDVPWYLLADFCTRFLEEFYTKERPVLHHKAVTEILMDIEIVGLQCNGQILDYLDLNDVHRIRRLQELDLDNVPVTISLEKFYLDDLTTFIFPVNCTDLDLAVIGRNCSKLQVLKVPESKVTDKGLHALSQCSELRVVDIARCPVSFSGINDLLSVHKKIEEFAHIDGTYCEIDGSIVLFELESSVCRCSGPSITRVTFENGRDHNLVGLKTVVDNFPNLTYLIMNLSIPLDLSPLKSLKLTGIEIIFFFKAFHAEAENTWQNLKTLLSFIGTNITTLKFTSWDMRYRWHQDTMNFIFNSCPNIEHLTFIQEGRFVVTPPFQKLKELVFHIPKSGGPIALIDDVPLEFSTLSNLETLSVINYGMNLQTIESMMLDNIKFPKLSVIEINCLKPEDVEHLERTARNHNLDFKIKSRMLSDIFENQLTSVRISIVLNSTTATLTILNL